ncbi:hypothetical protein HY627_01630 [Candidatus Uhrbacteria bacterium]|nr:hypothetical protein [Candidatus Uhrbacteria bacterium]
MGLHLEVWAEYLPFWLGNILAHNQRTEILKDIKVPSDCGELPCGCRRDFYPHFDEELGEWQIEWRLSVRDTAGNPLPKGSFRHVIVDKHMACNTVFSIQLPKFSAQEKVSSSFSIQLREVARKEQPRMQSPFDTVDELATTGMRGEEIAATMVREGYEPSDVVEALREHKYEVHTQLGNDLHLRGVSSYPKTDSRYVPLRQRGTGELAPTSVHVDVEKPDSPYHALPEQRDPFPLAKANAWPSPR